MRFNFWFKFKYIFIWALGGYFVFHPLAMIIGSFMSGPNELFIRTVPETVASEAVASFSFRMLPWSLLFAILNGVVGWFHATLKLREREIRQSFQAQTVLNKLLKISLDITPLEAVLARIIDEIISLPWFALESKGAVFVVEDDATVLEMKAQRGLTTSIQKECLLKRKKRSFSHFSQQKVMEQDWAFPSLKRSQKPMGGNSRFEKAL